jgi:uroporphyrinogen-III synthase
MSRDRNTSNILALGDNTTLTQLTQNFQAQHITMYCFNPLAIIPVDWQKQCAVDWHSIDKIIVTSSNGVTYGINQIIPMLAPHTQIFSIGPATGEKIKPIANKKIITPPLYNSESLLTLDGLQQLAGQKIILFKGCGGRTLLAETIQQRGGILYTIDCYARKPIITDLTQQLKFWQDHHVQQLIVSSLESMQAFIHLVPADWQNWLKQLTWIVTSARLEHALEQHGFNKIKRAEHFSVSAIQSVLP